jgi:Domain of unknown function (DUF4440)
MDELIKLEEQGWQVLSTEGDAAKKFYSAVLRDDAVMLFPGDLLIVGKQKILESFSAQPWKSFHIEGMQVISLSENAAVLVYKVTAQREGRDPSVALISSTYARSGGTWKMVLHQQTPV